MAALKIKKASFGMDGAYNLLDDMGFIIGVVIKKVEHYNLRRSVTVTTWRAWFRGAKIDGYYSTRKAAVAAIQALYDSEEIPGQVRHG